MIEDEVITAELMKQALEESGHEICGMATRASLAAELIYEHDPDLVILDLRLKGVEMDGFGLAKIINQLPNTTAIVISAYTDPASMERLEQAGIAADRVFHKPFDEKTIIAWVNGYAAQLDR